MFLDGHIGGADSLVQLEAGCDPMGQVEFTIESVVDGAMVSAWGMSGGSGSISIARDLSFDSGDRLDLTLGETALDLAELSFTGPAGEILSAHYSVAGGGGFAGGADCRVWGAYAPAN